MKIFSWVDRFGPEVPSSVRAIAWRPAATAVAVLTLALGVGAAATMYTALDSVLLRPLPYPDSDRLVWIWSVGPDAELRRGASNPDFLDWRRQSRALDIAGWGASEMNLTGVGEPERLTAALTLGGFFGVIGVSPALGVLDGLDLPPAGEPNVFLSHRIWTRRFGQDSDVVGRQVTLNDVVYTVAAVMPADFRFPDPAVEVWIPIARFNPALAERRDARLIETIGRLRSGFDIREAQAELDLIAATLGEEHPETNRNVAVEVVPALDEITGTVSGTLWTLFAAAACLLLIASVNLANLFLARASSRHRDLGDRAALGASRRPSRRTAVRIGRSSVFMRPA